MTIVVDCESKQNKSDRNICSSMVFKSKYIDHEIVIIFHQFETYLLNAQKLIFLFRNQNIS